jgi:hypothetical protein
MPQITSLWALVLAVDHRLAPEGELENLAKFFLKAAYLGSNCTLSAQAVFSLSRVLLQKNHLKLQQKKGCFFYFFFFFIFIFIFLFRFGRDSYVQNLGGHHKGTVFRFVGKAFSTSSQRSPCLYPPVSAELR